MVLRALGQIRMDQGDKDTADSLYAAALDICLQQGLVRIGAQVIFWRGMLRLAQDRAAEAEQLFLDVLHTCRSLDERPGQAQSLRGLGLAYHQLGDRQRARSTLDEALELVRQPRPTLMEGWIREAIEMVEGDAR
jgi:tetratricopeptide (TPR) repeat protein